MNDSPLARVGSACLGIGGVCQAVSVLLSAGHLAGPEFMLRTSWIIAHNVQFIGAALLIFGVVTLYQLQQSALDSLGHVAFVMALLGCAFLFADAERDAALLPFIAGVDHRLVMPNGVLFHPPIPALRIGVLMFGLGWLLFGIATAQAGVFPKWTGAAIALGAVLVAMSPSPLGPFPWGVQALGSVIMAIAMANIGLHGWMRSPPNAAGAASAR